MSDYDDDGPSWIVPNMPDPKDTRIDKLMHEVVSLYVRLGAAQKYKAERDDLETEVKRLTTMLGEAREALERIKRKPFYDNLPAKEMWQIAYDALKTLSSLSQESGKKGGD